MSSSDNYYNRYLKNKSKELLIKHIEKLKLEMSELKNTLETPEFYDFYFPSVSFQLNCTREHLERTVQALIDIGGIYTTSKDERRAELFSISIPSISKVTFVFGGSCDKYEIYTVTVEEDYVCFYVEHSFAPRPSNELGELYEMCTKQHFFNAIKYLYLGEWKVCYNNPNIVDGAQWALTINFSDGHEPFKSGGSNAYPYNFDVLLKLLYMDNSRIQKIFLNR